MFYKITNLIKINYNLKKKNIKTILYKNDFIMLKIFIKFNIVKNIKKLNNKNEYVINFNYINNTSAISIINLYRPSKPFFINLKNLTKLNKKKNDLILLSTNKGIITCFEAENLKIGGLLILKLIL